MNTVKVKTSFSKLKDDDLATNAKHIIDSLTGNASYPNPIPSLDLLNEAHNKYVTALAAAVNGGLEKTNNKNQKRDELQDLFFLLSLYVQQNCGDDLSILLSSGFEARKPGEPIGILDKPENLRVDYGPTPGSLKLHVNKIDGARSYRWEYTAHPATQESVWSILITTSSSATINNLENRKQYNLRVAGIGTEDTVVYSDIISKYTE